MIKYNINNTKNVYTNLSMNLSHVNVSCFHIYPLLNDKYNVSYEIFFVIAFFQHFFYVLCYTITSRYTIE